MKCPECGIETRHGGTWETLVGYPPLEINGVEHVHNDNCLKRRYHCMNGHHWVESIIRTCNVEGCNWTGKKECSCSGPKVIQWSDPEDYYV